MFCLGMTDRQKDYLFTFILIGLTLMIFLALYETVNREWNQLREEQAPLAEVSTRP